jgi:hypothetical protein
MKCSRCKSHRLVRFIDGFGKMRIFCRDCWNSLPINVISIPDGQKKLSEFENRYYKVDVPSIPR